MENNMKKFTFLLVLVFVAKLVAGQQQDTPFKKDLFPGQEDEFKEAYSAYKTAQGKLYKGGKDAYLEAIPYFEKAYEFNPNYSYLNYEYGMALLYSSKKYQAGDYFEKAYELNPEVSPDIFLFLGLGYQLKSEWEVAIENFNKVLNDDKIDDEAKTLAGKKIEECENGIELSEIPARVWIDNLGAEINTQYPEYAPVVSADERRLFFTSRREDSKGGKKDAYGEYYEDVYYSTRTFGDWSEPQNMGDSINTDRHDATIGLSPDGRSLLIYNTEQNKKGDILISKDKDGTWTMPKPLSDKINTKNHEPSASLSFDEKKLFFVSDMPGGYGMHDIYVSEWDEDKGEWGKPINLGPRINTEFDERGVFIHPNNTTLYFSSNGHNTIGGLDVFKSELNDGSWGAPENLKPPINTPDDDVYFTVTGDERYAYYSSFRPGGIGEKDIYRITFLGDEKEPIVEDVLLSNKLGGMYSLDAVDNINGKSGVLLSGFVKKIGSGKPVPSHVTIKRTEDDIIVFEGDPDTTDGSFYAGLEHNKQYIVTISNEDGLQPFTDYIETADKEGFVVYKEDFELFDEPVAGQEISFEDVFFDFDKSTLRSVAYGKLDKVVQYMKTNPNVVIEVGGYTDSRGSSSYNKGLSRRRAKAAESYLIKKGISKDRLKSVGYGESKPFVTDAEINKMSSKTAKEAAHQKNRRTAFKILSN